MSSFYWGSVAGFAVATLVYVLCCKFCCKKCECKAPANNEDQVKKAENIKKAMEFIDNAGRFTNDDLQSHLGLSNTTVGRYIEELEQSGKIRQEGKTGKFVYYIKK